MPKTNSNLGNNIRDLRKAYGETQSELGVAIGVEHNTISTYESGRSQPDLELMQKIASRYGCSVDQLIRADFSGLDFSGVEFTWKSMMSILRVIYPYACSDKALEDPYFAQGYDYTKKIMSVLENGEELNPNVFERAIEVYTKSIEESNTLESAANLLCLIFIFVSMLDENAIKMGKALQRGKVSGVEFVKNYMVMNNEENETSKRKYARELNEEIVKYMRLLKSSPEWNYFADYYLALKYIIGFVDTDYGQAVNKIIGLEMMLSFLTLGNPYAFAYVDKSMKL